MTTQKLKSKTYKHHGSDSRELIKLEYSYSIVSKRTFYRSTLLNLQNIPSNRNKKIDELIYEDDITILFKFHLNNF